MHVVIAGGGRVGSQTASHLADDGHSVTVIESHEPTARTGPESDPTDVVVGDAVSPDTTGAVSVEEQTSSPHSPATRTRTSPPATPHRRATRRCGR